MVDPTTFLEGQPLSLRDQRPPRVTVGMSTRNSEGTLALAIQSILNQGFSDFELLICDDSSTDASMAIAHSFDDQRVIAWSDGLRKPLSARLNQCIARARGEYFFRMDTDDVAYPDRIEKQIEFLDQHPEVDLVGAFALVFRGDGEAVGKLSGSVAHDEIIRRPLMGFRMWHPTWAGRLTWFKKHLYKGDVPYAEDQELLYRAYATSRFAVIPEIMLGYRQNKLEVGKIIKARQFWWSIIGNHLHGFYGFVKKIELGAIIAAKLTLDCLAVGTGLNYRLLRHRARPLTDEETTEWRNLWRSLQNSSVQTQDELTSLKQ